MLRSRLSRALFGAALLATGLASVAHASPSVSVTISPVVGHGIITDDRGITLYRYTEDQGSTSVCYGSCARAWPPLLVDALPAVDNAALAESLGLTTRTDGSQQLTFQGSPLYYYVGDTTPGETNGQESDGVWFVVDAPA
jgi:predicted lipoprotein with Yx(FWY)xxD motif